MTSAGYFCNCAAFVPAGTAHTCAIPCEVGPISSTPADIRKLIDWKPLDFHVGCRKRVEELEKARDEQHAYACRMDALAEERLIALTSARDEIRRYRTELQRVEVLAQDSPCIASLADHETRECACPVFERFAQIAQAALADTSEEKR